MKKNIAYMFLSILLVFIFILLSNKFRLSYKILIFIIFAFAIIGSIIIEKILDWFLYKIL